MIRIATLTLLPALFLTAPGFAQDDIAGQFGAVCGACHMPDGSGVPGLAPPINDPALFETLGERAPTYVAGVILSGLAGTITVNGQTYAGLVMPPHGHLPNDQIAALGTYLLETINQTAFTLDTGTIVALRETPLSHADLRAMREGGH